MRRIAVIWGALGLAVWAQLYLPAWPILGGSRPPVVAAVVLYAALRLSGKALWTVVFAAALLHDGLDPGPWGPMLLAFPLLTLLAQRIRSEIFIDGPVTHLICGAVGGLLLTLISLVVYKIGSVRPLYVGHVLLRLVGMTLLGMITLPVVSTLIYRFEALLPRRRGYGWQ